MQSSVICRLLAGIALVSAIPVVAQTSAPTLRTVRPDVRASGPEQRPKLVKKPIVYLQAVQPTTLNYNPALYAAMMKDWKPITQGAVAGGPELFTRDGKLFLIATGQDKFIHAGRLDPATMTIDPESWTLVNSTHPSLGETSCFPQEDGTSKYDGSPCGSLTTGGKAYTFWIYHDYGLLTGGTWAPAEGSNAALRPAFIHNDYNKIIKGNSHPHGVDVPAFKTTVWDGSKMWMLAATYQASSGGANGIHGWEVVPLPMAASGFGCDYRCAYRRTDGSAAVVTFRTTVTSKEPAAYNGQFEQLGPPTPPLAGATGTPDLIERSGVYHVFMPRSDGGLSYIVGQGDANKLGSVPSWGSWQDLGGYIKKGTTPSCVRFSQGGICAIQSADGKIYAKRWGATGGL